MSVALDSFMLWILRIDLASQFNRRENGGLKCAPSFRCICDRNDEHGS